MNEIFRVSCARTWHEVVIHSTWSSECPYLVLKKNFELLYSFVLFVYWIDNIII